MISMLRYLVQPYCSVFHVPCPLCMPSVSSSLSLLSAVLLLHLVLPANGASSFQEEDENEEEEEEGEVSD